jgi:hypothetical protein
MRSVTDGNWPDGAGGAGGAGGAAIAVSERRVVACAAGLPALGQQAADAATDRAVLFERRETELGGSDERLSTGAAGRRVGVTSRSRLLRPNRGPPFWGV